MEHDINLCIRMLTLWEVTFCTITNSKFVLKITIHKSLWGWVVYRLINKKGKCTEHSFEIKTGKSLTTYLTKWG
jgi:hypothetical protein